MRTRAVLGGTFASVAVLVLGWQVGTVASQPVASAGVTTTATTPDTTTPDTTTVPDATLPDTPTDATGSDTNTETAPSTGTTAHDGTFVGSVASTRFGNMQVQVTIADGAIADVVALQVTDHDRRSVQISNRAVPVLRSEVLAAQSASVATVGGATYTSDGYLSSLQSALDQAGF
ncbi:MAG: FMN-binding protein [Leifsonia flava]